MTEVKNIDGIFLSQIGTHDKNELSVAEMRDEIVLYHLFARRIMVSDSTINNNPKLRTLFYKESVIEDYGCQCDLLSLIKEGSIVPVVRDSFSGFNDLRLLQSMNPTPDLPSQKYCELIDETCGEVLRYLSSDVSRLFKQNLLDMLKRSVQFGEDIIYSLTEYVQSVETPLYAIILDNIKRYVSDSRLTVSQGYELDQLVYTCYGYNVPLSRGLICCDSKERIEGVPKSDAMSNILDEDCFIVDSQFLFHSDVIRAIPAYIFEGIKVLPSFDNICRSIQNGIKSFESFNGFKDTLGSYFSELEEVLKRIIPSKIINRIHKMKDSQVEVRWHLSNTQAVTSLHGIKADGTPSEQILRVVRLRDVYNMPALEEWLKSFLFGSTEEVV